MRNVFITLTLISSLSACADDVATTGETGAPCEFNFDCADGICLTELENDSGNAIDFEGGYCSSLCKYVDQDGDGHAGIGEYEGCTEDGLCLIYDPTPFEDNADEQGYCFSMGCQTDWDCRDPNYVCYEFGYPPFTESQKACVPIEAIYGEQEEQRASYPGTEQRQIYHPTEIQP